jgi:hypothetical protein
MVNLSGAVPKKIIPLNVEHQKSRTSGPEFDMRENIAIRR